MRYDRFLPCLVATSRLWRLEGLPAPSWQRTAGQAHPRWHHSPGPSPHHQRGRDSRVHRHHPENHPVLLNDHGLARPGSQSEKPPLQKWKLVKTPCFFFCFFKIYISINVWVLILKMMLIWLGENWWCREWFFWKECNIRGKHSSYFKWSSQERVTIQMLSWMTDFTEKLVFGADSSSRMLQKLCCDPFLISGVKAAEVFVVDNWE